jgi:hypothetical protein
MWKSMMVGDAGDSEENAKLVLKNHIFAKGL